MCFIPVWHSHSWYLLTICTWLFSALTVDFYLTVDLALKMISFSLGFTYACTHTHAHVHTYTRLGERGWTTVHTKLLVMKLHCCFSCHIPGAANLLYYLFPVAPFLLIPVLTVLSFFSCYFIMHNWTMTSAFLYICQTVVRECLVQDRLYDSSPDVILCGWLGWKHQTGFVIVALL